MGSLVSSEILSSNGKPLILLFLGEFVRDPSSKLLSETHQLKVAWNGRKITIHLFAQFSACLAAIFLQKMPELVLVHLGWSSGTRSVVEVEIIVFEPGKPIPSSSLSYSVLSIHGTNISGSFTRFPTSIKGEKKEVSKIRFFVDLTIHLTVIKKRQKNNIGKTITLIF